MSGKKIGKLRVVIAMFIALLVWENNTHIVEYKLFNRQGSYLERSNDTLQALTLSLQRPLTGFGIFNNYTRTQLSSVSVTDNSNSFTTMIMYLGFPMAAVYFGYFVYRLRKIFDISMVSFIFVTAAFFIFMNSEQISIMTLFLLYLYPLSDKGEQISSEYNTNLQLHSKRSLMPDGTTK